MTDSATSGPLRSVGQLKTAADLSRKMDSLRSARQRRERDWKLNVAFYNGNQYSYWNPGSKRIENLPVEDGEKPRYRVRIVSNQISLGVQSLVSKVIRTKPIWGGTPAQPGDKAVKAAQFSEDLLGWWWRTLDMAAKYEEAILWSLLADNGYWKLSWDPFAAKEMRFMLGPDGLPIVDAAMKAEFRAQLEQAGIDPRIMETVAYMGDVKVEVMSPFDIYLDPTAKSAHEAKWVICAHHLEPDEIKARWGKDVRPDKVSASPDDVLPASNSEGGSDPTVKTVYVLYHKKTASVPNGRYTVFIEDPDEIFLDQEWPEAFPNELPIVQFRGIRVPGSTTNSSVVTQARPLQKQLNRLLSQITEYTNLVIKPRIWAPVNSLRERITTEPGAVYQYTPVGNFRPEIEQLPTIPPYVFEFLNDLGQRIRDTFGLTEVTEGGLPPNLEAADAIDLLQEMAIDRIAPSILANEVSLARAGQFLLHVAQKLYEEPRLMTVMGLGGVASVREFSKADFAADVTVHVEAGSSMPRTRAARRKQIERFMELGLIDARSAWKHYDIADVKDLAVQFAADEDHALREHDKLIKGQPLNPEAMNRMLQELQTTGLNPETQEPLQSPEEIQYLLQKASLEPGPADTEEVHAEKHRRFITSQEFESHSPEVRQRFLMHYELTLAKLASRVATAEPEAPRVSLQLKGAVTPTAESAILRASGVDVNSETLTSEPPMETWVADSVDKPDADARGAGQEGNDLAQAAATMLTANLANADAQQKFTHNERQQGRDEELHAHQVRKAAAEADLAEKKVRESSFKKEPQGQRPSDK